MLYRSDAVTTVYVQLRVVSKRAIVDRMIRDVFLEVRGVQYCMNNRGPSTEP